MRRGGEKNSPPHFWTLQHFFFLRNGPRKKERLLLWGPFRFRRRYLREEEQTDTDASLSEGLPPPFHLASILSPSPSPALKKCMAASAITILQCRALQVNPLLVVRLQNNVDHSIRQPSIPSTPPPLCSAPFLLALSIGISGSC